MNELMIAGSAIRRDAQGRYCLNDCHRAAGALKKDEPSRWSRLDTTLALIAELGASPEMGTPLATLNDGFNNGTYAVKELVYAYAMWISPSFHLQVIRAFDGLVTGQLAVVPQFRVPTTLKEALLLAADLEEHRAEAEEQAAAALKHSACHISAGTARNPRSATSGDGSGRSAKAAAVKSMGKDLDGAYRYSRRLDEQA